MAKTKFFRVAVEGATATDGRTITREMIDQSAAGYNAETYTARINCEHVRGFSPQPPFNAYGSVVAVKAEDAQITIDGKAETRRALFAQLDANEQLVATVKADQKIFTSCEFAPNFARTDKHGLVGLAITDNPASLGTEALKFSGLKSMWDARKTDPANLFSAAEEVTFELEQAPADTSAGAFAAIANFFTKMTGTAPAQPSAPVPPVTPPAANDNLVQLSEGLGLLGAGITALNAKIEALDVAGLRTELGTLKSTLASAEAPGFSRDPATGGGGGFVTNC